MAGITASAGGLDALISSVRRQIQGKMDNLQGASAEAAEFGAKTAQSYTATRPGAKSGKGGRIDSGAMIAAIRHEPVSFSLDLVEARYGFVDKYEEYFKMQTVTGFTHNRSGEYIAPTFALRDSIGPTKEFAINAGRRAI